MRKGFKKWRRHLRRLGVKKSTIRRLLRSERVGRRQYWRRGR